jgi:type VI secretion system secreted protein Hcp
MDLILFEVGSPEFGPVGVGGGAAGPLLTDDAGSDVSAQPGIDASKCIELISVYHGVQQQINTDVGISARVSGRPQLAEFACVKYADGSSPKLYEFSLRAKRLDGDDSPCRIHVLRNSGDQLGLVFQFVLSGVLVTEFAFQSNAGDMATESFALNFEKIAWVSHLPGPQTKVATGWDVVRNRPFEPD